MCQRRVRWRAWSRLSAKHHSSSREDHVHSKKGSYVLLFLLPQTHSPYKVESTMFIIEILIVWVIIPPYRYQGPFGTSRLCRQTQRLREILVIHVRYNLTAVSRRTVLACPAAQETLKP